MRALNKVSEKKRWQCADARLFPHLNCTRFEDVRHRSETLAVLLVPTSRVRFLTASSTRKESGVLLSLSLFCRRRSIKRATVLRVREEC